MRPATKIRLGIQDEKPLALGYVLSVPLILWPGRTDAQNDLPLRR